MFKQVKDLDTYEVAGVRREDNESIIETAMVE